MSKILLKDINKALRQCRIGIDYVEIDDTPYFSVYHCHPWDHGYDGFYGIVASESGHYIDTEKLAFHGTRREFYNDMRDMTTFLFKYFYSRNIQELIVAPCHKYYQFSISATPNDIYHETYTFLRQNHIRKNERSGIKITFEENIRQIEMVIEGAFRGDTQLCLFVPSHKILITPNHHFGITFYTQNREVEKNIVLDILEEFPTLGCYDHP